MIRHIFNVLITLAIISLSAASLLSVGLFFRMKTGHPIPQLSDALSLRETADYMESDYRLSEVEITSYGKDDPNFKESSIISDGFKLDGLGRGLRVVVVSPDVNVESSRSFDFSVDSGAGDIFSQVINKTLDFRFVLVTAHADVYGIGYNNLARNALLLLGAKDLDWSSLDSYCLIGFKGMPKPFQIVEQRKDRGKGPSVCKKTFLFRHGKLSPLF